MFQIYGNLRIHDRRLNEDLSRVGLPYLDYITILMLDNRVIVDHYVPPSLPLGWEVHSRVTVSFTVLLQHSSRKPAALGRRPCYVGIIRSISIYHESSDKLTTA